MIKRCRVESRRRDANVGLGVRPDLRRRPLRASLDRFLSSRGLRSARSPVGGYVPMSGPLAETMKGSVLLAGDAAGQVLATSGGGIFTAMMCGYWAGKAAALHTSGRGALEEYESWWRKSLGDPLERGRRLFESMAPAFDDPEALEQILRLLGPEGLGAILRCQDFPVGDRLSLERTRPR